MNKILKKQINRFNSTSICLFMSLFMFVLNFSSYANVKNDLPQAKIESVTINIKNKTLDDAVTILCKDGGVNFGFHGSAKYNKTEKYSLQTKGLDFYNALSALLSKAGLQYNGDGDKIIISNAPVKEAPKTTAQQLRYPVNGRVLDEKGEPIIGATVIVLGTPSGAITDSEGGFSINVKDGLTIEISYAGFISKQMVINKSYINLVVKLKADELVVEDVVVTGIFERATTSYTGSASTHKGEDLIRANPSNILTALSILDPSFKMVENNDMGSNPNYIPDFEVRGSSSLPGVVSSYDGSPNMPTFIMDGFEVNSQQFLTLILSV